MCIMSARVRPPSARVKEAPLLVFSALNGLAHRAAKRIAFWRTSRVLGVICIADFLMSPPVCRVVQASSAARAPSEPTRPTSEPYQRWTAST